VSRRPSGGAPVDANEVRAAWERAARRAARGDTPPQRSETPTFMGVPAAVGPEDLEGAAAAVLGIPLGALDSDVAGGPAAIRRRSVLLAGLGSRMRPPASDRRLQAATGARLVDYGDVAADPVDVEGTFVCAHDRLADIFAAGALPIVLGGDHSVTIPVLQVLAAKLAGRLGIVAFDARLDLEFEPRYRAGSQWARAFELGVVEPANFVEVGVREAASGDVARMVADELGIHAYTMAEIDDLGIVAVAQEALEAASAGTEALYLSVDLDVVDPGGGELELPCPAGLGARELLRAVRTLAGGRVTGLDICGLAPCRDPVGRLAGLATSVAAEVLYGLAAQRP
jgi:arginase family enzyme